jgi:hypothetical protein
MPVDRVYTKVEMRPTAELCRQYFPKYTRGKLTTSSGFECDTLELPWRDNERNVSCIPEGVYAVVPRHSPKYGNHLHVTGVDGRSLILIHWGNYAASANPRTGTPDIRGCILVGYGYADLDGDGHPEITRSRDAFNALMAAHPDGFELSVVQ